MTRHATTADSARQPCSWARLARDILEFAVARGALRRTLQARTPFDDETLRDPDARVPLGAVYDLLEAAAEATGLAAFGLDYARAFHIEMFDALDDVRRERAAAFLDQSIAIAEVSYLLGYSEPSAFHRAFKRWTGTTPDAYRHGS